MNFFIIKININKDLINHNIYTKIHKDNITAVKYLLINDNILKNWMKSNINIEGWTHDFYVKHGWRVTEKNPFYRLREGRPAFSRSWILQTGYTYLINWEKFKNIKKIELLEHFKGGIEKTMLVYITFKQFASD